MARTAVVATKIHGVDASVISEDAINAGLEQLDIAPSKSVDLPEKVKILQEEFGKMSKDMLAQCTMCKQVSALSLDKCPFCGTGEGASAEASAGASSAVDVPEPGDEVTEPEEGEEEEDEEDEEEERAAKTEPPPPPVAQEVTKRRGRPPSTKLALVKGHGAPLKKPVVEGVLEEGPVAELQRRIDEIRELQKSAFVGSWQLAKKVSELEDSNIWKTRMSEDGKTHYKKYADFAKVHLGMSRRYVIDIIKVYREFPEKEVKELGFSKLRLMAYVLPEKRDEMMAKAKAGASKRQMERALGRKNADALDKRPKKDDGPQPSKAGGKITVALLEGKQKVPMYRKPTSKDDIAKKPAKKIGETPWAELKLENDTRMFITLSTNVRGEIMLLAEVKRVDPTK